MKKIIIAFILLLPQITAYSQQSVTINSNKYAVQAGMIQFTDADRPLFVKGQVFLQEDNQLVGTTATRLQHQHKDELGLEHFRYQQLINGIPVKNANYIVHVQNGRVQSQNGNFAPLSMAEHLNQQPGLTPDEAILLAKNSINAQTYKWEGDAGEKAAYPVPELIYYTRDRDFRDLRLAYKIDIYAIAPLSRHFVYVDAANGDILEKENRICAVQQKTLKTKYSSQREVQVECVAPNVCNLQEVRAGTFIETLDLRNFITTNSAVKFVVGAMNSNGDVGVDAHWAAEKFHDYFDSLFIRKSLNNAYAPLRSYVHYGNNYYNAFWDGYGTFYGDGNSGNGYRPLTSVDICAHEFTHGLVSYTAALTYYGESGSLNEALADIFGNEVEFYAKKNEHNSWTFGEDIGELRSMKNPNDHLQPRSYYGEYWEHGTNDNGGVHINSGVLNYWYYLICKGGVDIPAEGTINNGTGGDSTFTLSPIGRVKAAKLVYRMLNVYLTENATYYDAYIYSRQAAIDLDFIPAERASIDLAWRIVRIPTLFSPTQGCAIENANDTRNDAQTLSRIARGRLEKKGDIDWYKFSAPSNQPNFKVVLDMNGINKNYNMKIYRANNNAVLYPGSTAARTLKSFTYNGSMNGGSYLVSVSGVKKAFNSNKCYTISTSTSSGFLMPDNDSTDFDEEDTTISEAIQGDESQYPVNTLKVFPNPAVDHLNIIVDSRNKEAHTIIITDIFGRIVDLISLQAGIGQRQTRIDLAKYVPGIYYARCQEALAKFFVHKSY